MASLIRSFEVRDPENVGLALSPAVVAELDTGSSHQDASSLESLRPSNEPRATPNSPTPPCPSSAKDSNVQNGIRRVSALSHEAPDELLNCHRSGQRLKDPVIEADGWVYEAPVDARRGRGQASRRPDYHIAEFLRNDTPSTASVDPNEPPEHLCCPIMMAIMKYPVVASDGRTYDRTTIQRMMAEGTPSPFTREPLRQTLIRHRPLQRAIANWHRSCGNISELTQLLELSTVPSVIVARRAEQPQEQQRRHWLFPDACLRFSVRLLLWLRILP